VHQILGEKKKVVLFMKQNKILLQDWNGGCLLHLLFIPSVILFQSFDRALFLLKSRSLKKITKRESIVLKNKKQKELSPQFADFQPQHFVLPKKKKKTFIQIFSFKYDSLLTFY
jgi:hypothetical protein